MSVVVMIIVIVVAVEGVRSWRIDLTEGPGGSESHVGGLVAKSVDKIHNGTAVFMLPQPPGCVRRILGSL